MRTLLFPRLLLPLLLIGCQRYDNVQACEDLLAVWEFECSRYGLSISMDCSVYENYECDLTEFFDCLIDDYGCSQNPTTEPPSWEWMYDDFCQDLLGCD